MDGIGVIGLRFSIASPVRWLFAAARHALLIATLAAPAHAGAADAWSLDSLMQAMSRVKTARAHFVERKTSAVLTAPLESSGTLYYAAPDHLEKRTIAPAPQAMIVDGDRLVIEDGTSGVRRTLMLNDYPAVRALVESIRATLAGDRARLERFYALRLEGGEGDWHLRLTPRDAATREFVTEIRIGGSGNRVTSVEVQEASGDRSLMTIAGARR